MLRSSALCFALLILAGFCVVCSLAQFDEEELINSQSLPFARFVARRGRKIRPQCTPQGEACKPASTICCGSMGCYNYQGTQCYYPNGSCICRNPQYYLDW